MARSELCRMLDLAPALVEVMVVDDREERELAIACVKRKRKFWDDLALYVAVNGVIWLIWGLSGHSVDGGVPWPVWVSAIWGFLLLLDAWKAFGAWPMTRGRVSEAEIRREIDRMHGAH